MTRWSVLFAFVSVLLWPRLDAVELRRESVYIISIGVDQYEDARLALAFARRDAEAMYDLVGRTGTLLLDRQRSTRDAIIEAFTEAANAKPTHLVVFFSGHAVWDDQAGEYFLLPADANGSNYRQRGISAAELLTQCSRVLAREQTLVVDASFSNRLYQRVVTLRAADRAIGELTGRNLKLLTIDMAYESRAERHGALTAAVLEAARNKVPWDVAVPFYVWQRSEGRARASVYADFPRVEPDAATRGLKPSAATPAAPAPAARKDYALLVGVDQYKYFPRLVNPVRDVTTIAAELRDVYGFEVEVLPDPTQKQVREALERAVRRTYGTADQFLFFFAGHGDYNELLDEGYLVASDSPRHDNPEGLVNPLSHSNLRTIFDRVGARHVLVAIDSCFSGAFDPKRSPGGARADVYTPISNAELLQRKLKLVAKKWITSGGREYVSDGLPDQHSPFARQFLGALRSYGGETGVLTTSALFDAMQRLRVQPRYGDFPDSEAGGEFMFVTLQSPLRRGLTGTPLDQP